MSVYLKELKANIELVKTIDKNIESLKTLADDMQRNSSSIGLTAHYGEESRHKEGYVSSMTEHVALYDASEQIAEIMAEIRKLMIARQRVLCWIDIAKTALNFLSERERIIVELREFEELTWENIAFEYEERTGKKISDKTCNKIYWKAMNRMEPFFRPQQMQNSEAISQTIQTMKSCPEPSEIYPNFYPNRDI